MIHARYWCDLIASGNGTWISMIHPNEGSNPTFEKEVDRLIEAGIPENLIDMVGDGNCMFYCMLHYLYYVPSFDMTSMMAGLPLKHDYPLVAITVGSTSVRLATT